MEKTIIILFLFISFAKVYAFDNRWEYLDTAKTSKDRYYDLICSDSLNCIIWNLHEIRKTTFRRTTDGGQTWKDVYYNREVVFADITYPSKDLFIAAGDSLLLRTTNQGDSWDTTVFYGYDINYISFVKMFDINNGITSACTGDCMFNSNTLYFHTSDGGKNWEQFFLPIQIDFIDIVKFDSLTYWIWRQVEYEEGKWSYKYIWTYDNWKTFELYYPYEQAGRFSFAGKEKAWGAGGYHDPNDLSKSTHINTHTSYGCLTWETQLNVNGNGCPLLSIQFYDENFGMATTCMAKVYFTVDGGKTWHPEVIQDIDFHSPYDYALRSLQMPTRNTAYVISSGRWVLKFNGDWTDVEDNKAPTDENFISPNPATGEVNIKLNNHTLKGAVKSVRVYDVLGNVVVSLGDSRSSRE